MADRNISKITLDGVTYNVKDTLSRSNLIPFIIGTQTAVTGAWTGTTSEISSLVDGQTIRYWLPYKGSGDATLNLTLADGSTTGAINCYFTGTNRLSTHYNAGNVITLTYRSNVSISGSSTKYTGWWSSADYYTTSASSLTYTTIKAGTSAITGGNIVVGKDGVYGHLKSGNAFDITYPILYASGNIRASDTSSSVYIKNNITITTTQSISLTAYKPVFIKGNLDGTIFTPVSTTPLTQDVPTSADNYEYILLGVAYSSTAMQLVVEHPIYAFRGGAFGQISSKSITELSVSGKTITYTRADGTTGTITTQDTTYSVATASANGLMSSSNFTKLAGIEDGANKTVVDTSLSSTSTNPVQNKVVNTAITNLSNLVGSTAVSTQITNAITAQKGKSSGLAELDSTGKVPASQLPSYVDDVIEGYLYSSKFYKTKSGSTYSDEISGEEGKIYVDLDTNKTYRWAGSSSGFVVISETIALGETSSTAYRGDRGKIAYDHSQSTHARTDATNTAKSDTNGNIKINGTETTVYTHPGSGTNPHGTTKSDVGLGNVGNFKAVSTVASQGLTDTEKSNARTNIGAGTSSFSGSYNDLTNKPTIPTVGNGTITIKQAGTSKGTFTVNQSGDTTIELSDSNTDTKVTQTVTTSDANYPLLLAPSGQTATTTTTSYFDSGVTLNPNTNTIAANISGNAGSASKLGTNAGSDTQPVYFSNGVPVATSYSLAKSVPSNAVFTDTDTKVTAVGNHYTPSGGDTTSASGGTLTDITNSSSGVQVVTGVTKDAAGHVTGVTSVALKSTNTNTDTKVTQSAAITTAGEYPVLLGYSTATSSVTNTVNKTSTLKYNPSTQVLTVPKLSDGTKTVSVTDLVNIVLTNVSVATSAWASSTTYSDYPYQASITVSGCTSNHVPEVVFSPSDASSGIFAPVCSSTTDAVIIYATEVPSAAITILTVECRK